MSLGDIARSLAVAAPPAAVAAGVIWSPRVAEHGGVALGISLGLSLILALSARGALANRLRTITSVLAAYREGDFSIRAREKPGNELLASVLAELNQLGETLREHRLGEMEAWALLRKVMAEVDVVVLAFDDDGRVRLANDAAARLMGKPSPSLVGEQAASLGLTALLEGAAPRIIKDVAALAPPDQSRLWELRRGAFRLSGEPHTLVVLSDVSATLRDNERDAWRRLIRVMGHEINNSLAPIQSISESLQAQASLSPRPSDWEEDVLSGLSVIGRRAESLGRFMASYAALARLPAPRLAPVDIGAVIRKVAALERRGSVQVIDSADVTIVADADQLEQALINLVKNAVDATLERDAKAPRIRWSSQGTSIEIEVEDDGPGVSETANLFVPFFTTKTHGSGIGLVLSRQIAEAHGGTLTLVSRTGGAGATARLRLPINP
jgi:nitrogen fixation/metabolism regulation signal transduction histidine kinase